MPEQEISKTVERTMKKNSQLTISCFYMIQNSEQQYAETIRMIYRIYPTLNGMAPTKSRH